jgi:hypothetical protein
MKTRPMEVDLFHVNRLKDKYEDANSRLKQFCEGAQQKMSH